jgi:hypothetical protein
MGNICNPLQIEDEIIYESRKREHLTDKEYIHYYGEDKIELDIVDEYED